MDGKLKISKLERGGIELTYDYNFSAAINVDALKCINITLSYYGSNLLRYDIYQNLDVSADFYIEYIKNNLDRAVFDRYEIGWAMGLYKELLSNPAIRECLDKCIKNIPEDLYAECKVQMGALYKEYIEDAYDKYVEKVSSLSAMLRNAEANQGFVGRSKFGLIDDEIEEQRVK